MQSLEKFLAFPIEMLPSVIIALLLALTVHEFSHAFVAYKFGDNTAKDQGRLTLNPAAHLDLLGTLMIFIAGFGWAKPVPVNYFVFRNKRLARVLVSLAGPLSNLLLAIITMGFWYGLYRYGIFTYMSEDNFLYISKSFNVIISLNIVLFIFNLLPIPPLDGYKVLEDLAPQQFRIKLVEWEQYGVFIFLLLVITPLGDYIFSPIFNTIRPLIFYSIQNIFILIFGL
ncbi:zinc metalloprotease [Vulcanibacillus modesticaldus]|uniref:Zinc metalloprotease n=1 Tax=Vulcanibacillus modesticaldus TaxID=337097 RepID=A0A1D2YVZ9_9BACI|nr:site-2 protease family protein [Vulcanibacillus modesticaldus]OEF99869.1 zinc metalloprotease [Vulcanibacillus modesticaldus]